MEWEGWCLGNRMQGLPCPGQTFVESAPPPPPMTVLDLFRNETFPTAIPAFGTFVCLCFLREG